MANSNGKTTAPVSVTDVKTALGVSNNNMGYLCGNQHGKINKWAKYKPISLPSVTADRNTEWWKAKDGFCGLTVGWSSAGDSKLANIVNAYKNGTWTYNPPTGGASSLYRLSDFNGYDHNAVPFVSSRMKKGQVLEVNVMESKTLTLSVYYNSSSSSIQISDFNSAAAGLEKAHLAGALYDSDPLVNPNARNISSIISDTPVSQRGTITFTFSGNDIGTGRYIMLYLASPTVSNRICIPYDDNNYFLFRVNVVQNFPIKSTITALGNASIGYYSISSFSSTQPFPTDNGNADGIFFMKIDNNGNDPIYIGNTNYANYQLRMTCEMYNVTLIPCDGKGVYIGDRAIDPKSSYSGYFKATAPFKKMVETMIIEKLRTSVAIQAYNAKGGGVSAWQRISSSYVIHIKK